MIDIPLDLRPSINGTPIETAPTVAELHAIIGTPSRVVELGPPAPVRHRNNQAHVYDELGLEFREHHYTRRIIEGTIVFWPGEYFPERTPRAAFAGTLNLAGQVVPAYPELIDFLKKSPIRFRPFVGGVYGAKRGEFYVGIDAKGKKLASGRRSKVRRLVDLSFSWPHDDWGQPAGGE